MSYVEPIVNQEPKEKRVFTFTEDDIKAFALAVAQGKFATLVGGKVPQEQLPSYVDDVIEGYYYNGAFYSDAEHEEEITGEKGKIYIDLSTNTCYRWSGTLYVLVGSATSDVVAYEGTSLLPEDVVFEDWTLHRAIQDGNILWIVLTGSITNNSDSSASPTDIFEITLPSSISSKIYRQDGTTCDNARSSDSTILYATGTQESQTKRYFVYSESANKIKLTLLTPTSISSGTYAKIDCRVPIFLDIGTVQP